MGLPGSPSAEVGTPGPPQSATSVMGSAGNGANGSNANSGVTFDMDFSSNLGMSGMDDFTAMFRDDFERDFGAWFSTGAEADGVLDPMH